MISPSKHSKLMKIWLFTFLFLVITVFPLFATDGKYWEFHGLSNLDFNFSNSDNNGRLSDIEFANGFNNRPLLQLELSFSKGPWYFITEGVLMSLRPKIGIDLYTLFPQMVKRSFIEYNDGLIFASVGRRKQSIGVSDFNLFVNRDMPFFDGINFSLGKENGFRFDSLVSTSNLSRLYDDDGILDENGYGYRPTFPSAIENFNEQYSKYFLYHALSYVGESWFFMIGESAILANPKSIGDLNIFTNIHNENSDRANVGIEFQVSKLVNKNFLIYGLLAIDDLPTQKTDQVSEALKQTPNGVAINAGFRWHIKEGNSFEYPTYDVDADIRRNVNFGQMSGGFIINLDYVATSRWMYVRTDQHRSSKNNFHGFQSFYNYFFKPHWGDYRLDHFSIPYGLKYGGDTQLVSLRGSYESTSLKITGAIELLLQGEDAREREANYNYWGSANLESLDPFQWISSGNILPTLFINTTVEKGIKSWLSIYSGFDATLSQKEASFRVNLGVLGRF